MSVVRRALACLVLAAGLALPATACGAAGEGPAARSAQAPGGVPILLYHRISPAPAGTRSPALYVPATRFAEQMRALARAGYRGVTLDEVWDAWRSGVALRGRPVVISFDDGYASQWTRAARTLRARGWPGVLNLTLARVGVPGGLTRSAVRTLVARGWELDVHTVTHPDLRTVDAARLRAEVAGARETLQRDFGVTSRFFCYPFGRYDATVLEAVRAAGYLGATTTRQGLAREGDDPYALPRVIVSGSRSGTSLVALLGRLARA